MHLLFIAILWLLKVTSSEITGYGNTLVAYGGEAHYTCMLPNPTGVVQVTWQRIGKESPVENLATYSELFGEQVNKPYQGKVSFTKAALNSTSISLSNVSWQDESCYICLFNAFPDGSKRQQTCLTVQGISSVHTSCFHSLAPDTQAVEAEFHCSATGKPSPTIQWNHSQGATITNQSQTAVVANDDRTFTSSRVLTLLIPVGQSGHVYCVVNSGEMGETLERIDFPATLLSPNNNGERPSHLKLALIISALALISCLSLYVVIKKKDRLRCLGKNEIVHLKRVDSSL